MGFATVFRGVTRRARIAGRTGAVCASDSSAGTRILGYYLLCVGLVQLGIVAWGQLHGTNDVGWSRIGLLFPIRLVFDESASRTAYWLSLLGSINPASSASIKPERDFGFCASRVEPAPIES